jgi:pyrimidine oxygenase
LALWVDRAGVAAMLDDAAEMPGVKGIMLTFDDFLAGMDDYGTRIQPLMRCHKDVTAMVA